MCLLKERRADEVQAEHPSRLLAPRVGCSVMKGRNEINRIHLRCSFPSPPSLPSRSPGVPEVGNFLDRALLNHKSIKNPTASRACARVCSLLAARRGRVSRGVRGGRTGGGGGRARVTNALTFNRGPPRRWKQRLELI